MEDKYKELKLYVKDQYPTFNVFANHKRFVIEENKKEVLTYYPSIVMIANLKKIPNAFDLINDYALIRGNHGKD